MNTNRKSIRLSRRTLLGAGACALAGSFKLQGETSSHPGEGVAVKNEELVRRYYAAWEKKDWTPFETLLADTFTFTSANGDDHISKSDFKARCWESQIDFIQRFELESVIARDEDAFVKYLCHTKNGKSFQNVEYFRLKEGKVDAIECYFGAQSSFPSAVSKGTANAQARQ